VSTIAMPWLASVITRNPVLVALVFVTQRLPWLVFTLPAGVITDRVDRRRAIVAMDACRFVVTTLVALVVLARQDALPGPREIDAVTGTDTALYLVVLVATLLLGIAEVLRDNSAQTLMPAIVASSQLERANGRLYSAELVANTFVGPPLGSLLLVVAFAAPFFLDAATFLAAAALVFAIPGDFRAEPDEPASPVRRSWRADLREGVRWLWAHELLRPMAIILGIMNAATMMTTATLVLFAQEVLDVGPLLFTVIGFGGAIGGIVGGVVTAPLTARLGAGTCLGIVLVGSAVFWGAIGLSSHWLAVLVCFAAVSMLGVLWNVTTVSLRQAIIPSRLLGRVNSVYRFFAWGMMPIGAAAGGLVVVAVSAIASRELALRTTWFVCAGIHVLLFVFGRARLTTARIEAARAAAAPAPA
jgi:hypothetical protein